MSDSKKGILVVAINQRGVLLPVSYEALAAGRAVAEAVKEPLCAVVLGAKASEQARELAARGADKVFAVESPALENFVAENHAKAVGDLVEREGFGKVLIPGSVTGKSLAAVLSVRFRAGLAAEAVEVFQNGTGLKAKRYQYAGNVLSEVQFGSPLQVLTLQPMAYPRAEKKADAKGEVVTVPFEAPASGVEFVSFQAEESGEVDLGTAERIVSGGRGLGSPEGFKIVRDLAHSIGAAVGASRAVVDSGWIAYRHQVGLTGRAVRPKLYVAVGISGQIQHLAGMSSAGTIVAINTDPECPMMQMASLSVVGDASELLPLITEEIKKRKGAA